MRVRPLPIALLLAGSTLFAAPPTSRPALPDVGGDVSMLLSLERFGAIYRDARGEPADAIELLRDAGWTTFRVRLFVDPSADFDKTWGATQSFREAEQLSSRIVGVGGRVMLDLHYSDTWADPEHQAKPRAWATLTGEALERRVHDYTADVLRKLRDDNMEPAIVQVGNEITAGLLWPDGKLGRNASAAQQAEFVRLVAAGCRAVREASPRIRIVIHAHGGGKIDLGSFFNRVRDVDYDAIGLSFYPAYGESLPYLSKQIATLRTTFGKPVIVAETSYPRKPIDVEMKYRPALKWPTTPDGQAAYARDLNAAVAAAGGSGVIWWYPEATPVAGHAIYRDAGEGVFDDATQQLTPAAAALAR